VRELARRHVASLASDPLRLREARSWLVGLVLEERFSEEDAQDLAVAFSEACANVHRHAYHGRCDGRVDLDVTIEDDRVVVVLDHDGEPFDPARYARPDLRRPSESGYGLFLISSLVDEVSFGRVGSGRRLVLVKRKRTGSSGMKNERGEGEHV
jgi:serine/threonine-protein kinase RsbW